MTADAFDHAAALGRLLASRPGWESRAEALLGMIQFQRNDFAVAASYWQSALGRKEERHEGGPEPIVLRRDLVRALLRAGAAGRGFESRFGSCSASRPIPRPTGS